MASRQLRQYYDEDLSVEIDDYLGSMVDPWVRHRRRFIGELEQLSEQQWKAPTRCDAWNTKDVVSHLVGADSFWVVSILGASKGAPTSYLAEGFDPATTPDTLVEPMRALDPSDVLDKFRSGTEVFVDTVTQLDETTWTAYGESPIGHVSTRLVLAHALWDSWLHERDILLPLGIDVPVEPDELTMCSAYALAVGGVEGGLLDDPSPVGPGLSEPIDVSLLFDDLPDDPMRLVIDNGVRVGRAGSGAVSAGSAVELVEIFTGRQRSNPAAALPPALVEHLRRAFEIL